MSGHSKWATTKHKKAVVDARRGKLFARLIKNIEVAARMGGGDVNGNPTLYDAVQKARKNSVPLDNIERAVKRGSGAEAGGADWQTIMYEGYGPNGVALLVECLTDNRNRAAADVRTLMTRNGGTMADPGSVAYNFERKGVIVVPAEGTTEDDVLMAVLEAGAEEVAPTPNGEAFEVRLFHDDDASGVRLVRLRQVLHLQGFPVDGAGSQHLDSSTVLRVHLMEADVVVLGRGVQLDGHVDQSEGHRALPHSAHQSSSPAGKFTLKHVLQGAGRSMMNHASHVDYPRRPSFFGGWRLGVRGEVGRDARTGRYRGRSGSAHQQVGDGRDGALSRDRRIDCLHRGNRSREHLRRRDRGP